MMAYRSKRKWINLATCVFDFVVAVSMMMFAVSQRSLFAFVFGVIFVAMGVFFLRSFERDRRLENMTDQERIEFLKSNAARFMPQEAEEITRQAKASRPDETEGLNK